MAAWWENDDPIIAPAPSAAKKSAPSPEAKAWWENDDPVVSPPVSAAYKTALEPTPKPGWVEDTAKSIGPSLVRGAAGLATSPFDIAQLIERGARWGQRAITGMTPEEQEAYLRKNAIGYSLKDSVPEFGSKQVIDAIENSVTGPMYHAQTTPGKYISTATEFLPNAIGGGAGLVRKGAQVLAPATLSEGLGQATEGTAAEPFARVAGAILGHGGQAVALRAPASERILARNLEGVEPAEVRAASDLMERARQAEIPLTWDEAINHVTNGGSQQLTNTRRVVQNDPAGGAVLNPFMAERAERIAASAEPHMGGIAPPGQRMTSGLVGVRAQRAAEGALADTQGAINQVTRPDYLAAERQSITPQVSQALQGDPLYAAALAEVRGEPGLNRTIAHLPDDSVGVVDLVQRRLREQADAARMPGQANTSNLRASNFEDARTAPLAAAEAATGGPMGDYARARQNQATLRQNLLEPLEAGPLGTIRGTAEVKAQGSALLPDKPAYNSDVPSAQAMGRLVTRDPEAAANLVHSHLRTAFEEATQSLQSSDNAFGGAKFAAVIRGNGQQARNLQAVVEQLPNGPARWQGLSNYLDILEATGRAPQTGSMTTFNTQIRHELGKGSLVQDAGHVVTTGGLSWLKKADALLTDYNAGRNSARIARILVNQNSGALLERLASLPPRSHQAQILALRLSYMGNVARRPGPSPNEKP